MDKKEILHRSSLKEHEEVVRIKPFIDQNKEKRSLIIQKKRLHSVSSDLQKWVNLPLSKAKVDHYVQVLNMIPTLIQKIESKMDESYSWEMLAEILFHNEAHEKEMVDLKILDFVILTPCGSPNPNMMWFLSLLSKKTLETKSEIVKSLFESILNAHEQKQEILSYMIRCLAKMNDSEILLKILQLDIDHEVLKECLEALMVAELKNNTKTYAAVSLYIEDEPSLVIPILTRLTSKETITFILNDEETLDYLFAARRFFPVLCLEFMSAILKNCLNQEQFDFLIHETELMNEVQKSVRSKNPEVSKLSNELHDYIENLNLK